MATRTLPGWVNFELYPNRFQGLYEVNVCIECSESLYLVAVAWALLYRHYAGYGWFIEVHEL